MKFVLAGTFVLLITARSKQQLNQQRVDLMQVPSHKRVDLGFLSIVRVIGLNSEL